MEKVQRHPKPARNDRLAAPRREAPPSSVRLSNHQTVQAVNTVLLQRLARTLADDLIAPRVFRLEIHILSAPEMAQLNERYLRHAGPTDVLAFDYSEPGLGHSLCGEIFICLPEALRQARRFRATWQSELVRYIVHGVLHLCGYEDHTTAARRRMKRAEDAELRQLAARYPFSRLALPSRREPRRPPLS